LCRVGRRIPLQEIDDTQESDLMVRERRTVWVVNFRWMAYRNPNCEHHGIEIPQFVLCQSYRQETVPPFASVITAKSVFRPEPQDYDDQMFRSAQARRR